MVYFQTLLLSAAVVLSSVSTAVGQGRSGDNPGARRTTKRVDDVQKRLSAQTNQRAEQQIRRQAAQSGRRIGQRRAEEMRRTATNAGKRSDEARLRSSAAHRRGIETAIKHADVHAAIADGMLKGQAFRLTSEQRKVVADVFGDESILDPVRQTDDQLTRDIGKSMLPGSKANPRARLANAIRVRQTKISELRDLAIETNDVKLMEKADFFEQKLETFLENQARVEGKLAQAATRSRGLTSDPIADDPLIESDSTLQTAKVDSQTATETPETPIETRLE